MLHTDCSKPELMTSAYCTIARNFYLFFAFSLFSTFFTEFNFHDQSKNCICYNESGDAMKEELMGTSVRRESGPGTEETIKERGAKWRKMVVGRSPENSSV